MSDSNDSGFQFTHDGIGKVLKLNSLKVPPHQREYSWTDDKVDQLITDFSDSKATLKEHFLGTIVTIRDSESERLQIVDGQQRLTTTAIFLAEIRNHLIEKNGKDDFIANSIENEFLKTNDRRAKEKKPKLILNTDDNEFFIKLLNPEIKNSELNPTRDSHDLLLEASATARKWVIKISKQFAEHDVDDRLNDWVEFIEQKAKVVLLSVSDGSQAFKMFETLNDRGLKTTQADLVKSYLFGESGGRLTEAQSRWSSMKDNLQVIADDDRTINFLRHTLIATKRMAKTEDVYDVTQKAVSGEGSSVAYLAELEGLSRVYVSTFQSDSSHWDGYSIQAKKAIKLYNQFDPKPIRPLFLTLAIKFSKKEFRKSLEHLVCLTVRSTVTGKNRSGTIEATYGGAALAVYNGDITDTSQLKLALEKVTVTDDEFKQAFALTRSAKPEYARYYLRVLEAANANESEPIFTVSDDTEHVTLEHVLPKNSEREVWNTFSEEDARRSVNRLGNLCLMQKTSNSQAGNSGFDLKKQDYEKSALVLTNSISRFPTWDLNAINERQSRLAELAVQAWPI